MHIYMHPVPRGLMLCILHKYDMVPHVLLGVVWNTA